MAIAAMKPPKSKSRIRWPNRTEYGLRKSARLPAMSRIRISVGPKMPCDNLQQIRCGREIAFPAKQQKREEHCDGDWPVEKARQAESAHQCDRAGRGRPCGRRRSRNAGARGGGQRASAVHAARRTKLSTRQRITARQCAKGCGAQARRK